MLWQRPSMPQRSRHNTHAVVLLGLVPQSWSARTYRPLLSAAVSSEQHARERSKRKILVPQIPSAHLARQCSWQQLANCCARPTQPNVVSMHAADSAWIQFLELQPRMHGAAECVTDGIRVRARAWATPHGGHDGSLVFSYRVEFSHVIPKVRCVSLAMHDTVGV